ncbi:barstar family protein [Nonomuraea sp. NPDC050022]|uniref:barstar family protein n=1 Tax=Nonomuraea sp. NPDC050022 TaxID=3364358 RepID=UPI0037BC9961
MKPVWRWDQDEPLRWLLIDEYTGSPDVTLGVCADIDGLFVDPEPPSAPETYTLLGCEPVGPLLEALRRPDGVSAWLPSVVLSPIHDPRRPQSGCLDYGYSCSCEEELFDVTVLDHRPSKVRDGLLDIELRGYIRFDEESEWPSEEPPDGTGFRLCGVDDEPLGTCLDTTGVFHARPLPDARPPTLIGCRPEAPLRAAIEARSPKRRLVQASIQAVDAAGLAVGTHSMFSATVVESRPSRLGDGLVDIAFDTDVHNPLPIGARPIWQMWYEGRPTEPNLWTHLDRTLQHTWSRAALAHHPHERPDRPAGRTYQLDGRYVTSIDSFYCAIGEAINGPGGYFGWNTGALADCLRWKWGARTPFRLIWHDADVARRHLVPGYDRPEYSRWTWGPAITLEYLLSIFTERGVEVELR